jgi:hypothetical protein
VPIIIPLASVHHCPSALRPSSQRRSHLGVPLVLDQAGWYTSPRLVVHEGIHLLFLPPYSPELQLCERLELQTNESIAYSSFRTLEDLETAKAKHCVVHQNQI